MAGGLGFSYATQPNVPLTPPPPPPIHPQPIPKLFFRAHVPSELLPAIPPLLYERFAGYLTEVCTCRALILCAHLQRALLSLPLL